MSMKEKKISFKLARILIPLILLVLIGTQTTLFVPTYYRIQHAFFQQHDSVNSQNEDSETIPTVLIHGYAGSKWTFFTTNFRYSIANVATPSLVLTVNEEGEIHSSGVYDPKMKHPMIRVEFEDNTAKLHKNVKWLAKVMDELKHDYHIQTVNVIGHSYGGLDFTYFMEYLFTPENSPSIHKFVAIGTPFNGSKIGDDGVTDYDLGKDGPKKESIYFKKLKERHEYLPQDLPVLNIVGDLDDGSRSDGAVAIDSGLSARFIFNQQHYQEKTITGFWAAHSLLHENIKVDRYIQEFLWDED